jgi:uncharacterized protein (TIGR02145 family)
MVQLICLGLSPQVTIGSGIEPEKGALLDLKEEQKDDGTANTTKGLILPRTNLTEIDQLYPMYEAGSSIDKYKYGTQELDKVTEDSRHIGLTVYNLKGCNGFVKGIYTWDGIAWVRWEMDQSDKTMLFTDQDGNKFRARNFGKAGIWMTENLRAVTYANENPGPTLSSVQSSIQKYYCYPAPANNPEMINDGTNDKYFKELPAIGLLYNKAAALNGENNSTEEQGQIQGAIPGPYEVESVAPNGRIQGICPNGWHLPSDREWNELEREIYNNPQEYSSYIKTEYQLWNPQQWNPSWEILESSTSRGSSTNEGHGRAMMGPCLLPGSPYKGTYTGKSKISLLGGFDALLVGTAHNGKISDGIDQYGYATYFWSSSASFSNMMLWYRSIGVERTLLMQSVVRHRLHMSGIDTFFSVRCKKNNN